MRLRVAGDPGGRGGRLFALLQYVLPHHQFSRLAGLLANCSWNFVKNPLIRWFVGHYRVDLSKAEITDPTGYSSFNHFFTRQLRPQARSLLRDPDSIICPAEGEISQLGRIEHDTLLQAKGRHFTLSELFGGQITRIEPFIDGGFATIYLAPGNYHRVHMPTAGTLLEMIYVPGRLFSVNRATSREVPRLFARNERIINLFDTDFGPMALVMVGALIVGSIHTAWAGQVTPRGHNGVKVSRYAGPRREPIHLEKGEEMARFQLGSTVIVLTSGPRLSWAPQLAPGKTVRMGEGLGFITR